MSDRSWLLKPAAISCAKSCIKIIHAEFGIKLHLSDPLFLEKVERVDHHMPLPALTKAFNELKEHASGHIHLSPAEKLHAIGASIQDAGHSIMEQIEYHGKEYPRFDEQGREFKGVYRGNVRYA